MGAWGTSLYANDTTLYVWIIMWFVNIVWFVLYILWVIFNSIYKFYKIKIIKFIDFTPPNFFSMALIAWSYYINITVMHLVLDR